MIKNIGLGTLLVLSMLLAACTADPLERPLPDAGNDSTEKPQDQNKPEEGQKPAPLPDNGGSGYVWDEDAIPEILIEVPLDQWNALLSNYDRDNNNSDYVHCKVTYDKNGEKTILDDTGLRLRGNTSRRRPEKKTGDGLHRKDMAEWNHCHFYLNFKKFNTDKNTNSIRGIKKLYLKWFKDDPSYVREVFCYDLFRRAGVWTAPQSHWCRLSIHVGGDSRPAYFGVYEMMEPIDNKFIERRSGGTDPSLSFTDALGSLWKCTWGADLRTGGGNEPDESKIGPDDKTQNFAYELKEDAVNYAAAKAQLIDFMKKLNGKGNESFKEWIVKVCDVRLLLRTYAVNVAVGMWDDHWNNQNNFYLYFDSLNPYDYHFYFIPYDYDNTLGTSKDMDSGRQDPYRWGSKGLLMERMMAIPEFKAIYKEELQKLIVPGSGLMHWEEAREWIKIRQESIRAYIANDTGEDMLIEDKTAAWSNHQEYRLLSDGNNFFRIKGESILNLQ